MFITARKRNGHTVYLNLENKMGYMVVTDVQKNESVKIKHEDLQNELPLYFEQRKYTIQDTTAYILVVLIARAKLGEL